MSSPAASTDTSDIPMPLVSSGVENGNLRELALARMKDFGAECRDVRYREVGVSSTNPRLLLTFSFTRSTTVYVQRILNCSDETMLPMEDGRHSFRTRTPRKTFSLVFYDCGSVQKTELIERSLLACREDVLLLESCTFMELQLRFIHVTQRSSNIKWVDRLSFRRTTDM